MSFYIIEGIIATEKGFNLCYREMYCRVVHTKEYLKELLSKFTNESQKIIKDSIKMHVVKGGYA